MLENGVKSVLVTILKKNTSYASYLRPLIYAARVVGWFKEHMPAGWRFGRPIPNRSHPMNNALPGSIVNPSPKAPVIGLRAAVTIDSAIVIETMIYVLKQGDNATEVA